MVVKIGIIKVGALGTSPIFELILDERADREDIDVRVIGSGSKMSKKQIDDVLSKLNQFEIDLIIFICPDPNAKQPRNARKILSESGIPAIIVGDRPGEIAIPKMREENLGYIIVQADPMIGARREFLDPTEMALFNADVLKVLSITGVYRLIQENIDKTIDNLTKHEPLKLPQLLVTAENAVKAAGFENPYAMSKAMAAYNIAIEVADINIKACFQTKEFHKYIPLVTAAHEMMSTAAKLADEAREIEKCNDSVLRTPHRRNGSILEKRELLDNLK